MKKNLTELVFVIDRSGSMCGLESDTIGGFNGMIAKQKAQGGECTVTTVLFDDRYEILHDRFELSAVKQITTKDYFVRGATALLDAIGSSVAKISNAQNNLPEDKKAEKVIICIITDGYENCSCEYKYSDIKKMITEKQEQGWEFIFMGANMDAVKEGSNLGIRKERSVSYCCDEVGIEKTFGAMSNVLTEMRCTPRCVDIGDDWKKEVEEDFKKRGRR